MKDSKRTLKVFTWNRNCAIVFIQFVSLLNSQFLARDHMDKKTLHVDCALTGKVHKFGGNYREIISKYE